MSARRFVGFAFRGGYTRKEWLCANEDGGHWWSDGITESRVIVQDKEGVRAYRRRGPGFGVCKVVKIFAVRKPKPAVLEPAPLPPNPTCFCCGVGVEPGPRDDGFTDGERVACGHCGATNYPTVADDDTVEMSDGAEDEGDETTPAPVVAAEVPPTRFALPSDFVPKMRARIRSHDGACGCVECVAYCLGFADCEDEAESKTRRRKSTVEAIAAAREEGRREAAGRIARLVDALENVLGGSSELTPHAIVEIEYVLEEERDEAAKGAAK